MTSASRSALTNKGSDYVTTSDSIFSNALRHVVAAIGLAFAIGVVSVATAHADTRPTKDAASTARGAPQLLLANVLAPHIDVTKYRVSEKYDGVRALWDGATLKFRSGRTVAAPRWFIDSLPKVALDGELWIARGRFDEVSGIVRKELPLDDEWRRVNYMIFELPQAKENEGPTFDARVKEIEALVMKTGFSQLRAVPQFRVKDRAELKRALDRVVKAGGEGLMLHLADAPYVTGRSDVLLKLKPLLDTEAHVIEHISGKGKHTGKMGALLVETKDGVRFKLGTGFSDAVRANPPSIGATVTYAYRDLTPSGKPRFASFIRVREDP
jgi:DNA ligase 1